jgi:hypothetical protein
MLCNSTLHHPKSTLKGRWQTSSARLEIVCANNSTTCKRNHDLAHCDPAPVGRRPIRVSGVGGGASRVKRSSIRTN